ncbi:MAG: retroviral-like aspartic protease family protein [Synechococcales bacterium]|nr:retroviral-like aspartic protease family protein [Synechococcales bacterium]
MPKYYPARPALVVLSGLVTLMTAGCSPSLLNRVFTGPEPGNAPPSTVDAASSAPLDKTAESAIAPTNSPAAESPPAAESAATGAEDPYPNAINRASLAFDLSQSAQSRDDWRLAASRWQQAVQLMETVPESSPNYGSVSAKLVEYRRNLEYAKQQAALPLPTLEPGRIVTVPVAPSSPTASPPETGTAAAARPTPSPVPASTAGSSRSNRRVFQVPIVRRSGGTPVVLVTFNGNQPIEMIVDTGASSTVITQPVARALGVTPVGQTNVATASSRSATFLLGYVDSLEVGGAQVENLLVAIAGPELSTGLLGHDFFGDYDITVRQDVVEFQER